MNSAPDREKAKGKSIRMLGTLSTDPATCPFIMTLMVKSSSEKTE
jgi:hypothetical protein